MKENTLETKIAGHTQHLTAEDIMEDIMNIPWSRRNNGFEYYNKNSANPNLAYLMTAGSALKIILETSTTLNRYKIEDYLYGLVDDIINKITEFENEPEPDMYP